MKIAEKMFLLLGGGRNLGVSQKVKNQNEA